MKKSQRLLTWILIAVLIVATVAIVACDDKPQTIKLQVDMPALANDQAAVIVKNRDGTFNVQAVTLGDGGTDATTAAGVLAYLAGEGRLEYSASGSWLLDVGNLNPDAAAHEYVAVYTSVKSDWSQAAGATGYSIGDVTLIYSNYGIGEMTVEPGALIYFEIQTW